MPVKPTPRHIMQNTRLEDRFLPVPGGSREDTDANLHEQQRRKEPENSEGRQVVINLRDPWKATSTSHDTTSDCDGVCQNLGLT